MTGMMEAASVSGCQNTSKEKQTTLSRKWQGSGHCLSSEEISFDCQEDARFTLRGSCVMRVCETHVWRKRWQPSCMNVSCCSAVQADARSVIDVSLCCVRHGRCDSLVWAAKRVQSISCENLTNG